MAFEVKWVTKPLGECLSTIIDHRGKTPKKLGSDWVSEGIPTISAKNVNRGRLVAKDSIRYVSQSVYKRWMNSGDVERGDCFLVSEGATLGEYLYWDEDYPIVLGQRIFCLRANPKALYPRYLYFYMTSHAFQSEVVARSTGTSVPGLRQTEVLKLQIRLPSMEVQRMIGDTFYNLNTKIELNRRMNETLEGIARALFKSWFVDFDPVRAKMDGQQPAGMSPEIANLFPTEFEHVNGDLVPKGWRLCTVPDVIDINPTRRLSKGRVATYLDMKNMPMNGHHPHEWTPREMGSGTKFINGDTLMARITPCLENGKTAFVDFLIDGETGWGSTEYIVLRPREPLPVEFGYYLARSEEFRLHAITNMTGSSGRQRVPNDCFAQFVIAIPPAAIASAFGKIARSIMDSVRANCGQSRTAASLRDTLLPKLLSGELRVPEADKMLEEVL